jgi:hypothetical protein
MNKILFTLSFIVLLLAFSCTKENEDLLRGTWERVNVENIEDPYLYEWVFDEGELIMYRRLKSDPAVATITDRGFYVLETNPIRTTLQLVDTSNSVWNEKWDVIRLNSEQLIIKLDIEGGVLLREFTKKTD